MTRTQRRIEEHRKGTACIQVYDPAGRPCAGVPVWAEQETHAFPFGCIMPDLGALPEPDRQRCAARLGEVFNRLVPAGRPVDPDRIGFTVPAGARLGRLRLELDRLTAAGLPLEVRVRGRSVGLGSGADGSADRAAAARLAELYTLCFAHPAVGAIVWDGSWDGEERAAGGGLLRLDFSPRAGFHFLHKLISIVWHTRAAGETDADGCFCFRGFFGDYRIGALAGEGAATVGRFSFPGGAEDPLHRLQVPSGLR